MNIKCALTSEITTPTGISTPEAISPFTSKIKMIAATGTMEIFQCFIK